MQPSGEVRIVKRLGSGEYRKVGGASGEVRIVGPATFRRGPDSGTARFRRAPESGVGGGGGVVQASGKVRIVGPASFM